MQCLAHSRFPYLSYVRVAEQILVAQGDDMDYYFATGPRVKNSQGQELAVIQHQELNSNDPHIVWVFFNAPGTGLEMQRDFCHFLEHLLTMVQAEFVDKPAVLHVRVVGTNAAAAREVGSPQDVRAALEDDYDQDYEEKKTDTENDAGYPSPRHVSDFDPAHVDIYDTKGKRPQLVSSEKRIAPKTTYEMADDDSEPSEDWVNNNKQKKKGFVSRPWRKDVGKPPMSVRPPRNGKKSQTPAPVAVIRARSADMTVQSGLTGPFFLDGSELRDVYENNNQVKAEALRQEWIQSSVLNRGLSTRIRALLDETTDTEDIPPIRSRLDKLSNLKRGEDVEDLVDARSSPDQLNEQRWDWLSSICHYPDSFLNSNEPLTSKIALDKIFESVEKVFDPGSAVACAGPSDVPAPSGSPSRTMATKSDRSHPSSPSGPKPASSPPRPNVENAAASPKRRGISSPVNTPTRGRRRNLDDGDTSSYDGELNYDPRLRAVQVKASKGKVNSKSVINQNHSLATTTTATSSRSASQRVHRPTTLAIAKAKTPSKPFAALKGLFRRKKQYRV